MKTICCVNMKGGVSKTTVAINIADCLASRHDMKVLIVDLDPQFNATQCLMAGEPYKEHIEANGHTVVNIFDDTRTTTSSVNGSGIVEPIPLEEIEPIEIKENLYLLPGALDLYRLEMTSGQGKEFRLKNYIHGLEDYDIIMIDTPPTPSAWMSAALIASDSYLVPVKPEPLSVTGIDLLRSVINRVAQNYNLNLTCLGVILTIAEEGTIVFREAKRFVDENDFWRGKRFTNFLPKATSIARAQGNQQLILDTREDKLKLALSRITTEVIARLGLEEE